MSFRLVTQVFPIETLKEAMSREAWVHNCSKLQLTAFTEKEMLIEH